MHAELQRAMGKHEEADFMIQRAVYALEMAWPSRCNPAAGMHITISYDEEINRPMFRALFLHAQVCTASGSPQGDYRGTACSSFVPVKMMPCH